MTTQKIADEALKRYPPSMAVEGHDDVYYRDDEYGYDETARNAFISGAEWATVEALHPVIEYLNRCRIMRVEPSTAGLRNALPEGMVR